MLEHRLQITNLGKELFRICSIEFSRTSELQRQICGGFLFGMVYAYGKIHALQPLEVHALVITMLQDLLAYSASQAGAFSSRLIDVAAQGSDDTTSAIIHRGIDGHHQLTSNQNEELRQNLLGIFKTLNAS